MEDGPMPHENISVVSDQVMGRLMRLSERVPGLVEDFAAGVQTVGKGSDEVTAQQFNEICLRASIRTECLLDWDDEYFDEQFEDTVAILLERRTGTIEE